MSVGFLSSPAQTFNITVNCDTTVQPELKITSANGYETAFEGVIKLTKQTGMATGVGVRMLFDDRIATFDTYVNTQSRAVANETLEILSGSLRADQRCGDARPRQHRSNHHSRL